MEAISAGGWRVEGALLALAEKAGVEGGTVIGGHAVPDSVLIDDYQPVAGMRRNLLRLELEGLDGDGDVGGDRPRKCNGHDQRDDCNNCRIRWRRIGDNREEGGTGSGPTKARRAIELSLEKYCSVIHSLAPDIRITHALTLG